MSTALFYIFGFACSVISVLLFKTLASRTTRLLDIPNERSSHSRPVVRGAGIAIALAVLSGYILATGHSANFYYLIAAISIAAVSFLDDLYSIPLLPRLLVHFLAASILVYFSGGYSEINLLLADSAVNFGTIGPLLSVLFIVWSTNAFNFMDGIDGIAGAQGVGAGAGWMLFGLATGQIVLAAFGALISAACLGFLLFNWHPARVFMGDVGSTFLGFTLAVVPIVTTGLNEMPRGTGLSFAIIFLWLFLFDSVYTRIGQIVRLRPFWRAHREHLYQKGVIEGWSHSAIAALFGFVALALAVAVLTRPTLGDLPLASLLLAGPIALILFARKKRLT